MPDESSYITRLSPKDERAYMRWFIEMASKLGRDLDPNDPGYDMRGLWRAMQLGHPGPARDPYSGDIHFPDTFKTPLHPTLSAESIYAPPGSPTWNDQGVLVDPQGAATLGYIRELMRR